ncbi:MAG: NADAR family protein [Neomegalonema sp.]|nr:NADAR family protein [Neomegalonema sp.]
MDVFTKDDLIAAIADGARPKFVLFWGHTPQSPTSPLGAACLSQWFPAAFTVDEIAYPTAEHYMMAEKARLFGDEAARQRVWAATSPGAAKAVGREVRDFVQATWEAERFEIVRRGSRAKFAQNPEMGAFLLATRDRVLVEASPRDRIWGAGVSKNSPIAEQPDQWPGLNLLGFALMAARADLLAEGLT